MVPIQEPFFMFKIIFYILMLIHSLNYPMIPVKNYVEIATKTISLDDRYKDKFVNNVFKDNILLTLNYMTGNVRSKTDIVWSDIERPKNFVLNLKPGESFAFHDQILPEFIKSTFKTTNAHFNFSDGFKSDGYLMGDGVCHLASLIYWAAKDAGLTTIAPTNHDFAKINEVPKEYGVAIYSVPNNNNLSARQNLYITNNLQKNINFIFKYDGVKLTLSITKTIS
jgi:hypothetical protein